MKSVVGWSGLWLTQESIQVEFLVKLKSVIEFNGAVCDGIILEPHQVQVENRWERGKDHTLLCILEAVITSIIFVVTVQHFCGDVVLKRLLNYNSINKNAYFK